MKKKALVLIVSALLALGGCHAPDIQRVKLSGSGTVGLRMGQTLALELDSNATTGYLWEITYPDNEDILKEYGKPRYVQKTELIGAGGYQLFRFKPLKKGTTVLKFEYKRSWETGIKPAKTYIVRVVVT